MDFSLPSNSKKLLLLEILAMVLVVMLAATVRYPYLENNPGWYTDEGTLIDIAQHLNKCKTADFQISVAYEGIKTTHFPPNMPTERFAYDTRLNQAKYVVIDPVWENFCITSIPEVEEMADMIISTRQMVFKIGDIQIYQNPYIQ